MKRTSVALLTILTMSLLFLYGCPKKADVTTAEEPQKVEQAPAAPADEAARQAEQQAAEAAKRTGEEQAREAAAKGAAGLQPIYFDFDRSVIRSDARSVMQANAEWLKANPSVKVRIEGNCDERGTIEYNQALGQRRASATKKYLADLGVNPSRIALISYGKEKPVCAESTEECWQKNRRADLVAE
jgi:peptidoglycan-associated lipoprotein